MPTLMATLGIDRLSSAERLQLLAELLDSLEPAPALTEAQREELDRRVRQLDQEPNDIRPWAEVKARILARLGR